MSKQDGALTTAYTRAQLAAAVDEAHAALHEWDEQGTKVSHEPIRRAHEALHRVGAGVPRVGCVTQDAQRDPELRAVIDEWRRMLERELPCGHSMADLIYAPGSITKCGACVLERQRARASAPVDAAR